MNNYGFSKILNICLEVQYILMEYFKYATFMISTEL